MCLKNDSNKMFEKSVNKYHKCSKYVNSNLLEKRFQIKCFILIDECVFICTSASVLVANLYPELCVYINYLIRGSYKHFRKPSSRSLTVMIKRDASLSCLISRQIPHTLFSVKHFEAAFCAVTFLEQSTQDRNIQTRPTSVWIAQPPRIQSVYFCTYTHIHNTSKLRKTQNTAMRHLDKQNNLLLAIVEYRESAQMFCINTTRYYEHINSSTVIISG